MAMKPTDKRPEQGDEGLPPHTPSPLDEMTHAEMRMLYAESTETMRFVKTLQWRTVGATLLTFLAIVFIAGFVDADRALANKLLAIVIVMTCAVMFTLVIYQFWMHNEMAKINFMQPRMSSLFAQVRRKKSKREGTIHRYTLLVFMVITLFFGAVVVNMALNHITRGL